MKYCLILFCFAILSFGNSLLLGDGIIKPMLLGGGIEPKCILESGAQAGDIAEIAAHILPTQRPGKCLLSCLLKNIGIGTEDVKSRVENIGLSILERLQENNPLLHKRVLPVMLKCQTEVDEKNLTDTCDFVLAVASCGVREGVTKKLEDIFNFIRPFSGSLLSL